MCCFSFKINKDSFIIAFIMLLYASAKQCEIPTVTINTKFETCCFNVYLLFISGSLLSK